MEKILETLKKKTISALHFLQGNVLIIERYEYWKVLQFEKNWIMFTKVLLSNISIKSLFHVRVNV